MGQTTSLPAAPAKSAASCPVDHTKAAIAVASPPACPVQHDAPPAECPVSHDASQQKTYLPVERVESSIPRDGSSRWDYPSPQQFYNALVKKGVETPQEHVETMVEIHNFLNERAWLEVLKWEKRSYEPEDIQLSRLRGRPGEMSPKARFWMFAGWLFPSVFNTEPPFDRHDWVVKRPQTGEEVRYVIDYYSAPPEEDGSPVFSLDVRPALDSIGSIKTRIAVATEEAWANFRNEPQ